MMDRLIEGAGCPFESLSVDGRLISPKRIIQILSLHLSEERLAVIERVVAARTRGIVPVVEGLVNTGNVSAVMRSAEALGMQSFHIVAGEAPVKHSRRTTQGAHKWLDVSMWNSPDACVKTLRSEGYRIVVTHVDDAARPIDEIEFRTDTALVFGNEKYGVSPSMLDLADMTCRIPMPGFMESFNISVAAAIALYTARRSRFGGSDGDLSDVERERLTADFCLRSVRQARAIVERAVRTE